MKLSSTFTSAITNYTVVIRNKIYTVADLQNVPLTISTPKLRDALQRDFNAACHIKNLP